MKFKIHLIILITITLVAITSSLYVIYLLNEDNQQHSIIQAGKILKVENTENIHSSIIYKNDLQEMQNMEEVLGHLRMAQENDLNGNSQLALAHISHAINELQNKRYAAKMPQEYIEHLELLLHIIKSSSMKSPDGFGKNILLIINTIDEIKIINIGQKLMNDQVFQIQTASYLLDLSKREYAMGLSSGNIFETNIEIQDSYAFTKQAQDILKNSFGSKFDTKLDEQIKIIRNVQSQSDLEDSVDSILDELHILLI